MNVSTAKYAMFAYARWKNVRRKITLDLNQELINESNLIAIMLINQELWSIV